MEQMERKIKTERDRVKKRSERDQKETERERKIETEREKENMTFGFKRLLACVSPTSSDNNVAPNVIVF